MEFLRFGSSIPGSYWGCCAADIIQDFNQDPDTAYAIQMVHGDSGGDVGGKYAGKTYREVFWQRLRYGTFSGRDMPNHGFFAMLTEGQVNSSIGGKWLAILKEAGFEFIRTVDNSVWSPKKNYVFALFRNVNGAAAIKDQFTPPAAWTKLPSVVPEFYELVDEKTRLEHQAKSNDAQKKCWDALPPTKWYTAKELEAAKVPIWEAGQRSRYPQQLKTQRVESQKADKNLAQSKTAAALTPQPKPPAASAPSAA